MRLYLVLVTVALTGVAPVSAQVSPSSVCQADFDGPLYNPLVSMGGPNLLLGIRTQATSTYAATRIEVFTGNQRGVNSIAIWSHDAANNQPLAPLGTGTWEMSRVRGWQGANLTPSVPLLAGTTFWVVWGPINAAQSSIQATGAGAQPYRGSFNGGASWNGPFQSNQWKFRIYCGSPGHYEALGTGCPGASRMTPELGWNGIPNVGGSMDVLLQNGVANDFALLTIGDSVTTWLGNPLPYNLAPQGAPGCLVYNSVASTALVLTDGAGGASYTLNIPPTGSLFGYQFYDQWFVHDATANPLTYKVSGSGAGTIGL